MARFDGMIGVKESPIEISPGIVTENIVEKRVSGDMKTGSMRWQVGEFSQGGVTANHTLSIVATQELLDDFSDVVYVVWQGRKWSVSQITYPRPRIGLRLGGIYNGKG